MTFEKMLTLLIDELFNDRYTEFYKLHIIFPMIKYLMLLMKLGYTDYINLAYVVKVF